MEGVNYATFEVLNDAAARDKNNTYYAGRIIDYIDSQTIIVHEYSSYISDKNGVYYILEPIKKIDRATFEHLGQGYIKDQKRVYYNGKEIGGADSQTFEIYKWMHGDAKDKNRYYR